MLDVNVILLLHMLLFDINQQNLTENTNFIKNTFTMKFCSGHDLKKSDG